MAGAGELKLMRRRVVDADERGDERAFDGPTAQVIVEMVKQRGGRGDAAGMGMEQGLDDCDDDGGGRAVAGGVADEYGPLPRLAFFRAQRDKIIEIAAGVGAGFVADGDLQIRNTGQAVGEQGPLNLPDASDLGVGLGVGFGYFFDQRLALEERGDKGHAEERLLEIVAGQTIRAAPQQNEPIHRQAIAGRRYDDRRVITGQQFAEIRIGRPIDLLKKPGLGRLDHRSDHPAALHARLCLGPEVDVAITGGIAPSDLHHAIFAGGKPARVEHDRSRRPV
jgi:hypothetical protein